MSLKEIKERVKIIDYAASLGFHPYKVGKYFTLKEHDSVRIDPVRNLFTRNSTGESGSVIDFAMCFTGLELNDAIKELSRYCGIETRSSFKEESDERYSEMGNKEKNRNTFLELPAKAQSYRNVYAYLLKTRCINKDIVDSMIQNKTLYQDLHNNCVFVGYNDEGLPAAGCVRGTNTFKRFVGDISGSDYNYGFFIPGTEQDSNKTLLITESVIDMMSYYSLNGNTFKYDSLSLLGVGKLDAAFYHLEKGEYEKVIIGLDNDDPGYEAALLLKKEIVEKGYLSSDQVYIDVPAAKDWNEQLVRQKGRIISKNVDRSLEIG